MVLSIRVDQIVIRLGNWRIHFVSGPSGDLSLRELFSLFMRMKIKLGLID